MKNKFSKAFIYSGTKYFMAESLMDLLPSEYGDIYMPTFGRGDWGQILRTHGVEKHIYASDINLWLVMAHNGIRDHAEEVISLLAVHRHNHSSEYYIRIRDRFNRNMPLPEAAASLIYITANSYKGILRMSADGRCTNVNARKNFVFNPDAIREHARFLQNTTIVAEDFAATARKAKAGDLVMFDPTYPETQTHACRLTTADHIRLAHVCRELDANNALFLETNANDPFVRHLYRDFCIEAYEARRVLAWAKNGGRDTELLITNYERILERQVA